ncbi:hypothetical protein JKY72_04555 [Candidatus Gracilibacteria bacterium]|nr:hypothetical protein [Candidatus Gracilibacteria bacterium]
MKLVQDHLGGETVGTSESAETPQVKLEKATAVLQSIVEALNRGETLKSEDIAAAKEAALQAAETCDELSANAKEEAAAVIEDASKVVKSDMEQTSDDPEIAEAMKKIRSGFNLKSLWASVKNLGKKSDNAKLDATKVYEHFDDLTFDISDMVGKKVPIKQLNKLSANAAQMIDMNYFVGAQAENAEKQKAAIDAWVAQQKTADNLSEDEAKKISKLSDTLVEFCENTLVNMGEELDVSDEKAPLKKAA